MTYDVYNLVGNRWYQRLLALPLVIGALTPGLFISWSWMVAREGKTTDWKDIAEGLSLLLGRKGFITKIMPLMPEYFARDFHPAQRDTSELEKTWREKLFGENGELKHAWRNAG